MSLAPRHFVFRLKSLTTGILVTGALSQIAAIAEEEPRIATAENVTLETRDGVVVQSTYYPGGFVQKSAKEVLRVSGKEVVPIIMLHGWDGQRREFEATASRMQQLGYAVVVPDLRGHGESISRKMPGVGHMEIQRDHMGAGDLYAMVNDVESVKKFLLEKNNRGEVNIESLCVVGAGTGAIVAIHWAAQDWSRQQLPSFRQGCDVKAVVLLSPSQSFKGATLNYALRQLQHPAVGGRLSILIVAGRDDRTGQSEATSIHNRLERSQTVFLFSPETSLSGTRLLTAPGLNVDHEVARFLQQRLVSRIKDFPWSERRGPFPQDE